MNLFFVLLYISFISFYEYFFSCAVNQILRCDHSCFKWTEKVVRFLHCVKRDVFFSLFFFDWLLQFFFFFSWVALLLIMLIFMGLTKKKRNNVMTFFHKGFERKKEKRKQGTGHRKIKEILNRIVGRRKEKSWRGMKSLFFMEIYSLRRVFFADSLGISTWAAIGGSDWPSSTPPLVGCFKP